jgi:hypothetical protein
MFRRKCNAKEIAIMIIDRFIHAADELDEKTNGIEKVYKPILKELKERVKSSEMDWNDVADVVADIAVTYLVTFLYDCATYANEEVCRKLLKAWIIHQKGRAYRWMAKKVVELVGWEIFT